MFPQAEFIYLEMLYLMNHFSLLSLFILMPAPFSVKRFFFFHLHFEILNTGETIALTNMMIIFLLEPVLVFRVCRSVKKTEFKTIK